MLEWAPGARAHRRLCGVARPASAWSPPWPRPHRAFGDLDAVAAAKAELVEALPVGGTAMLNRRRPPGPGHGGRTSARVLPIGSAAPERSARRGGRDVAGRDLRPGSWRGAVGRADGTARATAPTRSATPWRPSPSPPVRGAGRGGGRGPRRRAAVALAHGAAPHARRCGGSQRRLQRQSRPPWRPPWTPSPPCRPDGGWPSWAHGRTRPRQRSRAPAVAAWPAGGSGAARRRHRRLRGAGGDSVDEAVAALGPLGPSTRCW